MSEVVRFEQAPHVWFDKTARVLHCDRCPREDDLHEGDPEGHIKVFALAHAKCPEAATDASRDAARRAEFSGGVERAWGLR